MPSEHKYAWIMAKSSLNFITIIIYFSIYTQCLSGNIRNALQWRPLSWHLEHSKNLPFSDINVSYISLNIENNYSCIFTSFLFQLEIVPGCCFHIRTENMFAHMQRFARKLCCQQISIFLFFDINFEATD